MKPYYGVNRFQCSCEEAVEGFLTVVTYHYVRDLEHSRYPAIKGLTTKAFKEQVVYLQKHYQPIRVEDILSTLSAAKPHIPTNAVLLTFDDGYLDHYSNVFPILDEAGIQGCFFPPAKAILENEVLDVNKIHFVLASMPDKSPIIEFIFSMLDRHRIEWELPSNEDYFRKYAHANRFDTAQVIFIKRILQKGLPEPLRREIVDKLFTTYVTEDEAAFSRELYMNLEQLACMKRNGMMIGSHGYGHNWLDSIDKQQQESEIDCSLEFLAAIGCEIDEWIMSYPYGAYDSSLLEVVRQRGCKLGFTTEARRGDLSKDDPLVFPRFDTNDLPKDRNAEPSDTPAREDSTQGL
jgi:peptidoglycan/xylan/chitin deacetylase (PgdA/CDA1 family)